MYKFKIIPDEFKQQYMEACNYYKEISKEIAQSVVLVETKSHSIGKNEYVVSASVTDSVLILYLDNRYISDNTDLALLLSCIDFECHKLSMSDNYRNLVKTVSLPVASRCAVYKQIEYQKIKRTFMIDIANKKRPNCDICWFVSVLTPISYFGRTRNILSRKLTVGVILNDIGKFGSRCKTIINPFLKAYIDHPEYEISVVRRLLPFETNIEEISKGLTKIRKLNKQKSIRDAFGALKSEIENSQSWLLHQISHRDFDSNINIGLLPFKKQKKIRQFKQAFVCGMSHLPIHHYAFYIRVKKQYISNMLISPEVIFLTYGDINTFFNFLHKKGFTILNFSLVIMPKNQSISTKIKCTSNNRSEEKKINAYCDNIVQSISDGSEMIVNASYNHSIHMYKIDDGTYIAGVSDYCTDGDLCSATFYAKKMIVMIVREKIHF